MASRTIKTHGGARLLLGNIGSDLESDWPTKHVTGDFVDSYLDELIVGAPLPVAFNPVAVGLEEVWFVFLLAHVPGSGVCRRGPRLRLWGARIYVVA